MLAKLKTFALVGIDAVPVEVEVDASGGVAKMILVGLPEMAVKESIHRIERALANLGYQRPSGRTIINLAPADLRKDAGGFDLPIALGMLVATGQLLPEHVAGWAMTGELALEGSVRAVKGALSIAMAAKQAGITQLIVPTPNGREAAVVDGVRVYGVNTLSEAVGLLTGQLTQEPIKAHIEALFQTLNHYDVDFADVRGQEYAKRALIVAASAGLNVLMMCTKFSLLFNNVSFAVADDVAAPARLCFQTQANEPAPGSLRAVQLGRVSSNIEMNLHASAPASAIRIDSSER